jgi:hypothetical protein
VLKLSVLLSIFSFVVFAGKAEREFEKNELKPAIKAAEEAYKKSCGCGLKMSVDAALKTEDQMRLGRSVANQITENVGKYCTDEGSKKAMCGMSSLEVKLGKETKFTMQAKKGLAETDGTSYVSFDMMTAEIDK